MWKRWSVSFMNGMKLVRKCNRPNLCEAKVQNNCIPLLACVSYMYSFCLPKSYIVMGVPLMVVFWRLLFDVEAVSLYITFPSGYCFTFSEKRVWSCEPGDQKCTSAVDVALVSISDCLCSTYIEYFCGWLSPLALRKLCLDCCRTDCRARPSFFI